MFYNFYTHHWVSRMIPGSTCLSAVFFMSLTFIVWPQRKQQLLLHDTLVKKRPYSPYIMSLFIVHTHSCRLFLDHTTISGRYLSLIVLSKRTFIHKSNISLAILFMEINVGLNTIYMIWSHNFTFLSKKWTILPFLSVAKCP